MGLSVSRRVAAAGVVAASAWMLWGCLAQRAPRSGRPGPTASAPAKPASNAECLTCHMDFSTEELAAQHAKAGFGCVACHGDSEAHGGDELNVTKPDQLLGRAEIDPFCKACHPTHRTGDVYAAFVKTWRGRRRPNGRMVLDGAVCTDCHGNHAILPPDKQADLAAEQGG